MALLRRTHTCGELREADIGKTVVLNGWVNTYRAYNDQVFIDLRDRYGITQVVFEADQKELFAAANEVGSEFCLGGQVALVGGGEDLVVLLGERDAHHRVVLLGAEDDANRLRLVGVRCVRS